MPRNVRLVRFFEKMEMMRALLSAFAEISPARDAEFSHTFVTERLKSRVLLLRLTNILYDGQDVYNGLRGKPRHGGAADMMDRQQVFAQNFFDLFRFPFKFFRPFGTVFYHFDFHIFPLKTRIVFATVSVKNFLRRIQNVSAFCVFLT